MCQHSSPIRLQLFVEGQQPGGEGSSLVVQVVALREDCPQAQAVIGQQPVVKHHRKTGSKMGQGLVKKAVRGPNIFRNFFCASTAVVEVGCNTPQSSIRLHGSTLPAP